MKYIQLFSLSMFMLLTTAFGTKVTNDPTALEIIKKVDENARGKSSKVTMKMTIVRPDWQRTMTMKSWSKGSDYSLILLTGPARDKGTAFLKRKKEMWNWQPRIDRNVKMPPSMMSQSWMGSDFTNDDLVRESSIVVDYTHKLLGTESIEGREAYKIELIPKEEAAVVWGRIVTWVDKKSYIQLKTQFFDEDDYLVNTMLGKNIKTLGGRTLATRLEMIPEEEEGHMTIVENLSAEFDMPIKDSFFSIQQMKRAR